MSTPSLQGLIRVVRDRLLKETDFTQLVDCPLSNDKKAEFVTYRQTLRDLPTAQNIDAMQSQSEVVWPTKPS